jgi:hypothetical protein
VLVQHRNEHVAVGKRVNDREANTTQDYDSLQGLPWALSDGEILEDCRGPQAVVCRKRCVRNLEDPTDSLFYKVRQPNR